MAINVAGDEIASTQLHPYWVIAGHELAGRPIRDHLEAPPKNAAVSGRWVDAVDLQPGDILLLIDLGPTAVESVSLRPANYPVYNFAVQDLKCYAVGLHQVLVHNTHGDEAADAVNAPNGIDHLPKVQQRAVRALQQQVADHQKKLADYLKNPDAFDNKGLLKNAPTPEIRQKIIDGRVRHLQQEIKAFQDQIDQIIGGN